VFDPSGAFGHPYYEQAAPMFEVGSSTAPAQTHPEVEPATDYAGFFPGQWEPTASDLSVFDSMGYFPQPQQVSHTRTSIISMTLITFIDICCERHARDLGRQISRIRNGSSYPAGSGARKHHFPARMECSTICATWGCTCNTCRFLQFPKLP
jgi:hypothetical protein